MNKHCQLVSSPSTYAVAGAGGAGGVDGGGNRKSNTLPLSYPSRVSYNYSPVCHAGTATAPGTRSTSVNPSSSPSSASAVAAGATTWDYRGKPTSSSCVSTPRTGRSCSGSGGGGGMMTYQHHQQQQQQQQQMMCTCTMRRTSSAPRTPLVLPPHPAHSAVHRRRPDATDISCGGGGGGGGCQTDSLQLLACATSRASAVAGAAGAPVTFKTFKPDSCCAMYDCPPPPPPPPSAGMGGMSDAWSSSAAAGVPAAATESWSVDRDHLRVDPELSVNNPQCFALEIRERLMCVSLNRNDQQQQVD